MHSQVSILFSKLLIPLLLYLSTCSHKNCSDKGPEVVLSAGQENINYEAVEFGIPCMIQSPYGEYVIKSREDAEAFFPGFNDNSCPENDIQRNFLNQSLSFDFTNKSIIGKDISVGGCSSNITPWIYFAVKDKIQKKIFLHYYAAGYGYCEMLIGDYSWVAIDKALLEDYTIEFIVTTCD